MHNDALLANIIILPNNNEVAFLNLEYGAPNYAAFDIANHFCEFTGNHGHLDYSRWLPNEDYQLDWIEKYLRHKNRHLQWSICSVIQAENSNLDLDFVDHALQRFQQYKRWKSLVDL